MTTCKSAIVFDDETSVGSTVSLQLEELGVSAVPVASRQALDKGIAQANPDLVLLDLCLGETDAVEVLASLAQHQFPGRVILISGQCAGALDHVRRIGLRAGINVSAVLTKPFRIAELRDAIQQPGSLAATVRLGRELPESGLLSQALSSGWLEFWHQPQFDVRTHVPVGVELLARVRHPDRGVLNPSAFLPKASSGDLRLLTLQAMEAAVESWHVIAPLAPDFQLSVNVPGCVLHDRSLLSELKSIRERHPTRPPIVLELTETDVIGDMAAADEFVTRALIHGFQLSIDDFGSGYSTFDRLRRLPFDELKLERAVVHGCATDPSLQRICRAAVELGHGFGARVVAEGVESAADLEALTGWGFDVAQGFLFSPPLPLGDLADHLSRDMWTGRGSRFRGSPAAVAHGAS